MLRSIKKAFEIIKEQDNDTSITVHTIRVSKVVTEGAKRLIISCDT